MSYTEKRMKRLTKRLGGELSYLQKEYKHALTLSGDDANDERRFLLCDNYYLIESCAKNAVSGLETVKTSMGELGFTYPRLYCHMLEYIELAGETDLCSESLSEFLKKKQGTEPYSSDMLYAADAFLGAAIVSKIYEAYKRGGRLGEFIKMLYLKNGIDFDDVFVSVSVLEPLLEADPSGIYPKCDKTTKATYRRAVLAGAKKEKTDEISYAKKILEIAELSDGDERSFGYYLLKREKGVLASLYFPIVLVIFTVLSALYLVISAHYGIAVSLFYPLFILPVFELSKQISSMIISPFSSATPLPKLKIDEVGDDMRTLVVVTTLLFGEKNDRDTFDRLEDFCHLYRGENVYFGVLGDLRDAEQSSLISDAETIDYAKRRIEALNGKYGNKFVLFWRDRTYSACEKKYMGWERKRGALIELVRFIRGRESEVNIFGCDEALLRTVKYVITLDSDTRISHDTINKLIGCAAHPQNRPRIEHTRDGAVVTEGYGIMQPRMVSSLESVSRSYFSLMQCGSGGIEFYDDCAFELYQNIFGEGIFCGKGIFDVEVYEKVIDGSFPEDSVLSHDMLEGARLRAAYLGDVYLVDSAPASPMSYYDRLHRWIRGDVQSLAFCLPPINALSRFKLVDNLLRALAPVFSLFSIVAVALLPGRSSFAALFALMYLVFPALVSLVRPIFKRNVGAYKVILRSYFSYAVSGLVRDLISALYSVASLAHLCFLSLDAIIRAFWRMKVTRKGMLEWTTAHESDMKKNTLLSYISRMKFSVGAGLLIMFLTDELVSDICALMFVAFPFAAYLLSKKLIDQRNLTNEKRSRIIGYARDIWRFFDELVGTEDNYLPPDNYQIMPTEVIAHRTSPTNIGMYLCAVLSARDFDFIDSNELYKRLDNTLSTVEQMKKWNGHLYNWYDTRTLELLTPTYVSTVDSGNFFCALSALREGVLDYVDQNTSLLDIVSRIDALVSGVSFAPLYDEGRKLFYIGLDPSVKQIESNYYDLYMSEARCSSYFAIARGEIPSEHWRMLGRRFIGDGNHIGLASWSGTAFEYFMPALFLPTYRDSLAYEGMLFAFSVNKKNAMTLVGDDGSLKRIWGKSESAFYSFDPDMNYRYRAIGERKLALARSPMEDDVYAPYALFLMMPASVNDVLSGLSSMKAIGVYGKYGFFESVDLTTARVGHGRAIVRSYMAHHMGMSITACANAVFDDIFCRRFMHSPDMRASALLLAEKLPTDAIIYEKRGVGIDERAIRMIERMRSVQSSKEDLKKLSGKEPHSCIVSDTNMHMIATRGRRVSFEVGGYDVSISDLDSPVAFTFGFESGGKIYSVIGKGTGNVKIENSRFYDDGGAVRYGISYTDGTNVTAALTLVPNKKTMLISFDAQGRFYDMCPGLVFEPILSKYEAYMSHASFSRLFVESEFVSDENVLLFKKKRREITGREMWLAVAFAERGGKVCYETKKERLLPEHFDGEDVLDVIGKDLDGEASGTGIATVDPICAIKRQSVAKGRYFCEMVICVDERREGVLSLVAEMRKNKKRFSSALGKSRESMRTQEREVGFSKNALKVYDRVLFCLTADLLQRTISDKLTDYHGGLGTLWRFGISGDEKIMLVDASGGISNELLRDILASHRLLRLRQMNFCLVILYDGYDVYTNPKREEIRNAVIRAGSDELIGRRSGVFLIPKGMIDEREYEYMSSISAIVYNGAFCISSEKNRSVKVVRKKDRTEPKLISKDGQFCVYGGAFDNEEFAIDKYYSHGPWSYVYCNASFGTLVTHNSLGFTWYRNSREMRITKWDSDPLGYNCTEHILAIKDGIEYDLVALSDVVRFTRGYAEYRGELSGVSYKIKVGCDARLPIKAVTVEVFGSKPLSIVYEISFVMGDVKRASSLIDISRAADGVHARDVSRADGFVAYLFALDDVRYEIDGDTCRAICECEKECFFVLGARPAASELCEKYVRERINSVTDAKRMFEEYKNRCDTLFVPLKRSAKVKEYALLLGYYLPYQAYYVRMLAKSGFYQSSGAYGFRDQLQDSLAALYFDKNITKRQMIRCAAHQYEEGDVQHWWHATVCGGRFGIRSRYADDPLWLVYALTVYIKHTGDKDILKTNIPYLSSRELSKRENERCEVAERSAVRESLYMHCIRALERSLRFGEHGLVLFGGGDWNDGMNYVGRAGKGESVWLSWFLVLVLNNFIPICEAMGEDETAARYENIKERLSCSIEKNAWDGKWYMRGFYDDGKPLGSEESDECKIDMMSQSFAAFCGGGDEHKERVRTALYSVYDLLFDRKLGIVKLFTPAFDSSDEEPGYIKSYPAGIRENGGQYTHAAIWYAMALYEIGEEKMYREVMDALNPIIKCSDHDRGRLYRNEPYFMSADIYTADKEYGRAGWSGYTGSAAWYLRAICQDDKN